MQLFPGYAQHAQHAQLASPRAVMFDTGYGRPHFGEGDSQDRRVDAAAYGVGIHTP